FKIVGVEGGERGFSTEVRYEGSGRSPRGLAQQTSAWRCEWTGEEEPRLRKIEVLEFEEVLGTPDGKPWFEDCTEAVLGGNPSFRGQLLPGLDPWTALLDARLGLSNLGHEGLALGDVNGDGLDDLLVCQPGGLPNLLFVRNADGTATDRSAEAGVDFLDAGRSALLVDLDGDADADLAMVAGRDLLLLANDGKGRFSFAGAIPAPSASSMAAADVDLDGDLDLYLCGYAVPDRKGSLPVPYHHAENGRRNLLLRNEGAFRFLDATAESGLEEGNRRFSLAASFEDFDEDGDPDLFVANDFGRDNLYRNDGGRFRDVAAQAGVDDIGAGMGVAWGDFDGDGRLDLHVSNMFSSAGSRIVPQARFRAGLGDSTRAQFRHHARGNTLFRNLGGGRFADVSVEAGVTMGRFAWGSRFLDLDGDGREDLFVANGFVTGEDPSGGDL
ncbi:MAG: FG-GAP repeat domain-containing protein, partial [Planctomycetota bacterium]